MGPQTLISRDRTSGIIKIFQKQYTLDFLEKSKAACAQQKFPALRAPPSNPNFPENCASDSLLDAVDPKLQKQFQSDIGAFWWLAQISRRDIFMQSTDAPNWSKNQPFALTSGSEKSRNIYLGQALWAQAIPLGIESVSGGRTKHCLRGQHRIP